MELEFDDEDSPVVFLQLIDTKVKKKHWIHHLNQKLKSQNDFTITDIKQIVTVRNSLVYVYQLSTQQTEDQLVGINLRCKRYVISPFRLEQR